MFIVALLTLMQIQPKPAWRIDLSEIDVFRARALAVSDQGHVAVIDRDASQIVVVDGSGAFITRFGTSGQGPGELQAPVEICWSGQDQAFVIVDFGNSRLSFWDQNGVHKGEVRLPVGNLFSPRCLAKDWVFFAQNPFAFGAAKATLVKLDRGSTELSEVWHYKPPQANEFSAATDADNTIQVMFRWDPMLTFGLGHDFLAVAFGAQSQLLILDFNGKPKRPPIPLELPRYEVTAEQIEEGIKLMPLNMQAALRQGIRKPDGWPLIRSVHVDEQDRIWIIGSSRGLDSPHPVLAYNRNAHLIGRGQVEELALAVHQNAFYYFAQDEEENLYLEKATFDL